MTENFLFSSDALPKIKWSTIRAMGYSSKFWEDSNWNCMTGLAEVCTLVASLLFWTEISIKIRESSTATDRAAYWVAPSNSRHFQPQKIQDIDFRAPKRKKTWNSPLYSRGSIEFLSKLNQSENKPGILRVVPGFANNFWPKSLDLSEQMLANLYDTAHTTLPHDKLLELS